MLIKTTYKIVYVFALLWQFASAQSTPPAKAWGLWTVDISNDDKFIAVGGDDSLLRIYSLDFSLHKIFKTDAKGMIKSVQWHPKEKLLALSSRNGIWIFNPETNQETKLEGTHNGSRTIGWNYNGELLAAAAGSGKIWIWNKQGRLLRVIQKTNADGTPDKKDFLGIDWHPSKNIFTTVGDEIRIFDTSGQQLNVFRHRQQQAGLLTVKWNPSGEFFVTGDYGHPDEGIPTLLQFWTPGGKLIKEWNESKSEFRNIRWNKQGTMLATASDALRIWSSDGKLLFTGKQEGNKVLWGVDWTTDSEKLVTVSFDSGNIQLWNNKAVLLKNLN